MVAQLVVMLNSNRSTFNLRPTSNRPLPALALHKGEITITGRDSTMQIARLVRTIRNGIVPFLISLLVTVPLYAQNSSRTTADFLQIGMGARAAGLGGAFTALSEGAVSTYWNPAGLGHLENKEVFLSHFTWYQDISIEHGSFAMPISERLSVAASISYLNYGTIESFNENGVVIGELQAYDWAGGISLGMAINERLSVGATGKIINQRLDTYSGSAYAADFGVKYSMPFVTFGLAATNIGTKMKFDAIDENLPASVRAGVAVRPFDDLMVASADLLKNLYGETVMRNGLEFGFSQKYFLRTGFDHYLTTEMNNTVASLSFGAGLRISSAEFDYAFTPDDAYTSDALHRFSLSFKFGN
ncbi:MAG: PorV/PorQ family protein [candidate division Zixibacteria bacterium]|nr:PorV/PorQ family protein [candidate division Zixibacteria bacterium]